MIKALFLALLLFAGIFVFVDSGDLDRFIAFYNRDEVVTDGGVVTEVGETDIKDVAESAPLDFDEVGESYLPGENIQKTEPQPSALLTELGVLLWTNIERVNYGVSPLVKNSLLDAVAEEKLNDMFENQYFAHESPSGDYVGDVAENVGYDYLLIGENLTYGDFGTDKALVDAWMDSPGHRENILNEHYVEIGIAVKKGYFNGRTTWLAVQSFGAPQSLCDVASESLLDEINEGKDELDELEEILDEMHDDIEATEPKSGSEYNEKVAEYNALVAKYNALLKEVNSNVKIYNEQVREFEACVEAAT